jgi:hypothetical protein
MYDTGPLSSFGSAVTKMTVRELSDSTSYIPSFMTIGSGIQVTTSTV